MKDLALCSPQAGGRAAAVRSRRVGVALIVALTGVAAVVLLVSCDAPKDTLLAGMTPAQEKEYKRATAPFHSLNAGLKGSHMTPAEKSAYKFSTEPFHSLKATLEHERAKARTRRGTEKRTRVSANAKTARVLEAELNSLYGDGAGDSSSSDSSSYEAELIAYEEGKDVTNQEPRRETRHRREERPSHKKTRPWARWPGYHDGDGMPPSPREREEREERERQAPREREEQPREHLAWVSKGQTEGNRGREYSVQDLEMQKWEQNYAA